jgi:hypothetical protein
MSQCYLLAMKNRRRIAGSLFSTTMLVAGIVVGSAVPANAATVVGICAVTVGEPHASTHVQGPINSFGRLTCTPSMPNMHVRATLEKGNGALYYGNTEDINNVPAGKTLTSVSPIPCRNNAGTYRTQVAIAFTSPPGLDPRYHAKTYYSIWRSVACGVSAVATPDRHKSVKDRESVASIALLSDGSVREATTAELSAAHLTV